MQGIYIIKNKLTGKSYIGSSNNIKKRIGYHKYRLRLNTHWNCHLQRAWNIHKEENFAFSILEIVSNKDDLITREQFWIDELRVASRDYGYNLAPMANRSQLSEETKAKMSKTRRGKFTGLDSPLYGKNHSDESKQKIRDALIGRKRPPFSQEHRSKISARTKGKTYEELYGAEKAAQMRENKKLRTYEYHCKRKQASNRNET